MSEYMPWWWSLEVKYVVHVLFLSVKSPDNVTFLKHFMTNVSQQWIDVFDFGDFCGRWIINIYIIDMVLLSIGVHDFFLWVDGNCPALEIVSQNRPLFFISGVDPKETRCCTLPKARWNKSFQCHVHAWRTRPKAGREPLFFQQFHPSWFQTKPPNERDHGHFDDEFCHLYPETSRWNCMINESHYVILKTDLSFTSQVEGTPSTHASPW